MDVARSTRLQLVERLRQVEARAARLVLGEREEAQLRALSAFDRAREQTAELAARESVARARADADHGPGTRTTARRLLDEAAQTARDHDALALAHRTLSAHAKALATCDSHADQARDALSRSLYAAKRVSAWIRVARRAEERARARRLERG